MLRRAADGIHRSRDRLVLTACFSLAVRLASCRVSLRLGCRFQLAVEMIFHPLVWRGIPLRVIDGQPLGLFGWQGIVPAKAGVMAERMVDMVTTQLVDVEEVCTNT